MLLFYSHNLDEVIWRVPLQLNPIGSIRFEIRFKPNSANRKIKFGARIVQASGCYVNPMKRLLSADENGLPSPKRLSLTLKRPATHVQKPPQRFSLLTSEEDFRCAAKGVIPLNPKSSTKWTLCNLMTSRNSNRDDKVPENLLPCPDAEVVCKWLCLFVQEMQKQNGEQYPPATIRCQPIRERCKTTSCLSAIILD